MVLLPYFWRGKTYKTINGICGAVMRAHPGCSVSFGQNEMHVRLRGGPTYVYDVVRTLHGAEIADLPK